MTKRPQPKFDLSEYRKFIREASSYVSIVLGRRVQPSDADRLSDDELREIALLIDQRAEELKKRNPGGQEGDGPEGLGH